MSELVSEGRTGLSYREASLLTGPSYREALLLKIDVTSCQEAGMWCVKRNAQIFSSFIS